MKLSASRLLVLAALAGTSTASLADTGMVFSGRIGPSIGTYKGEGTLRLTDLSTGESQGGDIEGDAELAYGLQAGLTAGMGSFFGDFGVEFTRLDYQGEDVDRTDLLFSAGYRIGPHGTVFAGYRTSAQGQGFYDDELFEEAGPFIGGGLGGMAAGPLLLGLSVAYNFSKVDNFAGDGTDLDYDGISVKLAASLASAPQHSIQLRVQRFKGDDKLNFDIDGNGTDDARLDVELEETYLQLFYLYSFSL